MSKSQSKILLVEDEEILADILCEALNDAGYEVVVAADGQIGWDTLDSQQDQFGTILLDREMPRMDGIELLRKIKADSRFEQIPVIIETSNNDEESVREGLNAGAYYYLTKPFLPELLLAIVGAAMQQQNEFQEMQRSLAQAEKPVTFMLEGRFQFQTIEESKLMAEFLARACPNPQKSILGLQELLINAVEHGNLAISYSEKTKHVIDGTLEQEIRRRYALPEFAKRRVEVLVQRSPEQVVFTIRDEGSGFDWEQYLEFDPARVFDPHGRGIAMSKQVSFDSLHYIGSGNTVVVKVAP